MESDFPKMIWQTYKASEELPAESAVGTHSWISLNPGWDFHFCSDEQLQEFFLNFYNGELLDLYHALPWGSMKACLWNYGILHEFGGVYVELDTVCHTPLDQWLVRLEEGLLHFGCTRDGKEFSQAIVAGPAGHPAFLLAMDVIRERAAAGVDLSHPDPVHFYAGRGVWTEAIRRFLDLPGDASEILAAPGAWEGKGIVIHPPKFFNGQHARHLNASYNWRRPSSRYISWLDQLQD